MAVTLYRHGCSWGAPPLRGLLNVDGQLYNVIVMARTGWSCGEPRGGVRLSTLGGCREGFAVRCSGCRSGGCPPADAPVGGGAYLSSEVWL